MYKVFLHDKARKVYNRLEKGRARQFNQGVEQLKTNPFFHPNIKKLKGEFEGSYRYRVGSMRIVYSVNQERQVVYIEAIGFRGSVYK